MSQNRPERRRATPSREVMGRDPFVIEELSTGRRHRVVGRRFRIGGDLDDDLVLLGSAHEGMTLLFRDNGEVWWASDGLCGELELDVPFEIGGVSLVVRMAVPARPRSARDLDEQPTDPDIRLPPHLRTTTRCVIDDDLPTELSCHD